MPHVSVVVAAAVLGTTEQVVNGQVAKITKNTIKKLIPTAMEMIFPITAYNVGSIVYVYPRSM